MTNPMEEMRLPCSLDLCDGDGVLDDEDGKRVCPCSLEEEDLTDL